MVVKLTPYQVKENPPSHLQPDVSSRRLIPAKSRTPGYLCSSHRESTELAKAGEKEVQLQNPILQKGDEVLGKSKMPSRDVHSSQCTDPAFLSPYSSGSSVVGWL